MSMIRELNAELCMAVRQIDQQSSQLCTYRGQIDQLLGHVQATMGGDPYGEKMIQQLQSTSAQIDQTLTLLAQSKEKLLGYSARL